MKKTTTFDLSKLSLHQYNVTKRNATEPPFANEYWDNHELGIYVDVISKVPLFSSLDKYDSGCGWPSFTKPLNLISKKTDLSHGMIRTEVRSVESDAHLGHLFDDGPEELGGMRYCINSASLEFIPLFELKEKGYDEYCTLFEGENHV